MSLVVQLGTTVCNNTVVTNQQSSPLAATTVASDKPQFAASADLGTVPASVEKPTDDASFIKVSPDVSVPVQTQAPVVVSSHVPTLFKKANCTQILANSASAPNQMMHPKMHINNNGHRIQTINVQRTQNQLSHIAPQSKVQVLSNVVVPKQANFVLNKGPINSAQRQLAVNNVVSKQMLTNQQAQKGNSSVNMIASKPQITNKPQILNSVALQTQPKNSNFMSVATVQQQVLNNINRVQTNMTTTTQMAVSKMQTQPQTHVISRVITAHQQSKTQPTLKVNNSMVVQRQQSTGGIKTIPPQTGQSNAVHKVTNSTARMQSNMVIQQRSGIKTIPPQRSSSYTKTVQKTVNSNKQNNYVMKGQSGVNSAPRVQTNSIQQNMMLSPKSKQQIVVQTNRVLSQTPNSSVISGNVLKYHGQQFQVIQTANANSHLNSLGQPQQQQQQVMHNVTQQPVTVVRTVASYEDNNVPTGIANTLFSPSQQMESGTLSTHDDLETSQDNYLSEEDIIGEEVRPDFVNCQNPVLFDHNYHLPPPDSPPASPTPLPPKPVVTTSSEPSSAGMVLNGSTTSVTQSLLSYMYNGKSKYALSASVGAITNPQPVVQEDDAGSTISSDAGREVEPEGEETETAPEGEGEEDSVTRCICDFEHDDGYMICCDKCSVWQHVDCMFTDRQNIQEEYMCERCEPRRVDRQRARSIQLRKREEILNNGSSSDTSSASSLDTVLNNNVLHKKRQTNIVNNVPAPIGRRKSEPLPTQRRPLTVSKRSRRDAGSRDPPPPTRRNVSTKRRQEKKSTTKRKNKTRRSLDINEDSQESWDRGSSASMLQLRQWIERYEEAVTNHYSPELRARIASMKANGQHSDAKPSNLHSLAQASANVHKCRVVPHQVAGTKVLVSTMYLSANTPIIELRGKYMLGSQPALSQPGLLGRHHAQRPGPFLFFYRLPKDNTEVCVDTRTYGNDARFVRRSCKPNAEIRHCIEKGTLHLYLVTATTVEKNTELTIKHEAHSLSGSSTVLSCACNNPSQCGLVVPQVTSPPASSVALTPVSSSLPTRRSNGTAQELIELSTPRKRRGRRTVSSAEPELSSPLTTPVKSALPQVSPVVSPPQPSPQTPQETRAHPPRQPSPSPTPSQGPVRRSSQHSRAPVRSEEQLQTQLLTARTEKSEENDSKDKKKMTREERKMEAIMKAFERLEKQEQRKQESRSRLALRRESESASTQHETSAEHRVRRKRRKGRSRTVSTNSSGRRRVRLNSTDSYITSGDEGSLMSPPLPTSTSETDNTNNAVLQNNIQNSISQDVAVTAGQDTEGHAAGLLLALASSGQHNEDSLKSPVRDPDNCSSGGSVHSSPVTQLSSNCLLVAAAVEQITPGFKLPKTKKAIMNEWLNKSPEPIQPASSISPMSLTPQILRPVQPTSPLPEPCRQSLATLVQAVNMCSTPSSPRPPGGNAKKRWLRQAISEECDSPSSRPESPPSGMVAPPKKRRMARESLSSEKSFTPPSTPTQSGQTIIAEEDDTGQSPTNEEEFYNDEKEPPTDSADESNDAKMFNNSQLANCNLQLENPLSVENTDSSEAAAARVEIVDSNQQADSGDASPSPGLEPDAVLKERVAEMQMEFGNNVKCNMDTSTSDTCNVDVPENVPPPVTNSVSILDPRLRYQDSSQLLGKVEKTLQFYEQRLAIAQSKPENITPAKRKLSITEYRQRKQQGSTPSKEGNDTVEPAARTLRTRSNSASSATSSLSSDEDHKDITSSSTLPEPEKDTVAGAVVKFNSAPTLVEQQRENLTARLKREFGLFLPDDEDSKKLIAPTDSILGQRLSLRTPGFVPPPPPPLPDDMRSALPLPKERTEQALKAEVKYPVGVQLDTKYPRINAVNKPTALDVCETTNDLSGKMKTSPQGPYQNGPFGPVNYIPPFNNPVYPNTTQYTGFAAGSSYLSSHGIQNTKASKPNLFAELPTQGSFAHSSNQ